MVQAAKVTNRIKLNKRGWGSSPTVLRNIQMPLSMTYGYIERIRLNNYASQIIIFSSKGVEKEGWEKDVKPSNFLDNSGNKESITYKIYKDVYLNDSFKYNIGEITHDSEDNRESAEFKLYFIRRSPTLTSIDAAKLYNQLKEYSMDDISANITKFHQDMGLVFYLDLMVWSSSNDINILVNIASNMQTEIIDSISSINQNVHKDLGNTIVNFNTPMDIRNELFLLKVDDR